VAKKQGRPRNIPPNVKRIKFMLSTDSKKLESALSKELERLHSLYRRGHAEALLYAVDFVLRHYALGSWVTEEFARRLEDWLRWEVPDLAKAFGVARTGKKIPEARRREELRVPIVSAVVEYRRAQKTVAEALARTAVDFKVTKAFASKLYYDSPRTREIIEHLPPLQFRLRKSQTS
jgi:hypothetical protein